MCGRFEIHSALEIIAKFFGIDAVDFDFSPSYNIAPTQDILLVVKNGRRRLIKSRWGFVPSWSKDPSTGCKMINAKAETLAEKRSFKAAFEKQRCLVIADGFYEWQKSGAQKNPYYIRLKSHKPFGFAGLYTLWTPPEGEMICTSTIVTTGANDLIRPLHDRMPAIVPPDRYDVWLDPAVRDTELLSGILRPFPSEEMELYPVTKNMNSPRYNKPENILPLPAASA